MTQVSFAQPLVLLALVIAIPLVLFTARARLRFTSRRLQVGILLTRVMVAALIVSALAQPSLRPTGHGRAVVFALDVSDSVSADQIAWARNWISQATAALPHGSESSVIEFGTRAALAGTNASLGTDSTDLAVALKLAGDIVSRAAGLQPEVVLLTDGWPTGGSPALDALPSGIAVSYVPLPLSTDATRPVAVLHSLNTPRVARVGDRIDVQLDLQSTESVDAQLTLRVDQALVANGPVHLEPGETQLSLRADRCAWLRAGSGRPPHERNKHTFRCRSGETRWACTSSSG
jgi:hypothetical protein